MEIYNGNVITDNPDLSFRDISTEEWREYVFPDESIVRIVNPIAIAAKESDCHFGGGSHRVLDAEGMCHYVPRGWKEIRWAKNGIDVPFFKF